MISGDGIATVGADLRRRDGSRTRGVLSVATASLRYIPQGHVTFRCVRPWLPLESSTGTGSYILSAPEAGPLIGGDPGSGTCISDDFFVPMRPACTSEHEQCLRKRGHCLQ